MQRTSIVDLMSSGNQTDTFRIGFFLLPHFSMMAFASAIEPLRSANRLTEQTLFDWVIASENEKYTMASNGVEVAATTQIEDLINCRLIFICGGIDIQNHATKSVISALRMIDRHGVLIGAICTGTYVLAKAGLLDDRRCTIHWENREGLEEEFPNLDVTEELFEIDDDRITCSGGTAALDMMLHLIAQSHGHGLATSISEQFIHDRIRDSHDRQRMELRSRLGVSHPKLLTVVAEMEKNLEEPMPQTEIARRANLSTRQLERLFRKYLGTTPTRYYLNLRIARARHLLRQTSMSILSVALACGFVSASHFSKCYRETYGRTPRDERVMQ
jgi:transcriptional regulator GlxA family with amidase domain